MTLETLTDREVGLSPPLYLVEEVSHRVMNEYAEAIASLRLDAARAANTAGQEAIQRAADRLRSYADLHRALLPPEIDGLVDLSDYVSRYCASLAKASLSERCISIALEADEVWLPAEKCWRVALILAELVRNSARHGLAKGSGTIVVRILNEARGVTCMVCDNGRTSVTARVGRGRRLVQTLAAELGGGVEWTFLPEGCLVRIELPQGEPCPD